jgi:hypothetical protein
MKRLTTILLFSLFLSSPAYADPFTWTFTGVADSGHWDLNDLAGLAYTLRLTTDTAAPDQNFANDFGQYGFANITAEIDIATLGTRTLGNFTFIEQFTTADSDRLRIRGPNGGAEFVLRIPVGTLGDPDFLNVWGPVQTLGVDPFGSLIVDDPGIPNPPFHLVDLDTLASPITVSTSTVPEPGTLTLLGVGGALTALRTRRRRRG